MIDALIQLRNHHERREKSGWWKHLIWIVLLTAATVFTARGAINAWLLFAVSVPVPAKVERVVAEVREGRVRYTYVIDGNEYSPVIDEGQGMVSLVARWIGADSPEVRGLRTGDPVTVWKLPRGWSTPVRRMPIVLTLVPVLWFALLVLVILGRRTPAARLVDDILAGRRRLVPKGCVEEHVDRKDGTVEIRIRHRRPLREVLKYILVILFISASFLAVGGLLGAWLLSEEFVRSIPAFLCLMVLLVLPQALLLPFLPVHRFSKKGARLTLKDNLSLDRDGIEEATIRPEGRSERLEIRVRGRRRPHRKTSGALWYASLLEQEGIPVRFKA